MPTFRHGRSAKVVADTTDLSTYLNEAQVSRSMEPADVTTFGNNSKAYIPGHLDGTMQFNGFFDGSASAIDAVLSGELQSSTDTLVTFAPEGLAIGRNVYLMQALETTYDLSAPVADAVSISAQFQSDVGVWMGRSLHDLAAETSSTNSTSIDDAASSSVGGVGILHVTANTRSTTSVIKVQHSTDNSTWADLITFATVGISTATQERVTISSGTTINRYLRAISTLTAGTGSITYTVSFARGAIA